MEAPDLDVVLKPSQQALIYLITIHAIAAFCWLWLAPTGWLKWLVVPCIGLSAGVCLHAELNRQRRWELLQYQAGVWYLTDSRGERRQMLGLKSAFVAEICLIMRFRREGWLCLPFVLWPDSVDETAFRRLRMFCLDQRFYRQ